MAKARRRSSILHVIANSVNPLVKRAATPAGFARLAELNAIVEPGGRREWQIGPSAIIKRFEELVPPPAERVLTTLCYMARENPRVLLRLQAQNLLAPITFYVMKELLKGKRSWKPADEEIIDLVDNSLESDPEKNVAAACRRVAHLLRMKGLDPGRALERRYRRAKAKVMAEARKAKHRRTGGKVR